MIPTYVFGWPTGQELGDFLALDLGTRSHDHSTALLLNFDLAYLPPSLLVSQVVRTSVFAWLA